MTSYNGGSEFGGGGGGGPPRSKSGNLLGLAAGRTSSPGGASAGGGGRARSISSGNPPAYKPQKQAREKLKKVGNCACCQSSQTPLWREGKNGIRLCNVRCAFSQKFTLDVIGSHAYSLEALVLCDVISARQSSWLGCYTRLCHSSHAYSLEALACL
jgi:hypothetical protein